MLLKSRSAHTVGVGYDPRVRFGPRILPRPIVADTNTVFNGIYMRPNLANGGAIPASGALCTCPDIWIGGTTPVANFQTALATSNSYATQSSADITQGSANYIYVRGLNGSGTTQSTQVQLYGLPNAVIQWPSSWGQYAIPTDQSYPSGGQPIYTSSINNLASGAIGVAQDTFVWSNPQPPPPGSDHYCLITWLNNANNPFPNVFSQLDMSSLVLNNLGYGWRNTTLVSGSSPTVQMQTQLTIPSDISGGSMEYFIVVTPNNFPQGWQLSMSCSQTDSNGQPIAIPTTNMPAPGLFLGVYPTLEAGFSASLTFNLYQNGAGPAPSNATLDVEVHYLTAPSETDEAVRRGVVDFAMTRAIAAALRDQGLDIGPSAACPLGGDGLRTF